MSTLALRDHAGELLLAISSDMRASVSVKDSAGKGNDEDLNGASERHAFGRLGSGFGLREVVSEYRVLRGSVLRQWAESGHKFHDSDIADVGRFNASIDKSLTKAVSRFWMPPELKICDCEITPGVVVYRKSRRVRPQTFGNRHLSQAGSRTDGKGGDCVADNHVALFGPNQLPTCDCPGTRPTPI